MESPQGQVVSVAGSRLTLRSRLGALTLLLLCAVQFLRGSLVGAPGCDVRTALWAIPTIYLVQRCRKICMF